MTTKRKPLAERVEWIEHHPQHFTCNVGRIAVDVDGRFDGWILWVSQLGIEVDLQAKTGTAAKAEALRIVQADVLRRAEEWRD